VNWIINNLHVIGQQTLNHLVIALPPILLSFVLSIPIGWLANRFRPTRGIVLTVSSILYAVPSLPLLIIIPLVIGTPLRSPINLTIALTLYGIALMVRSMADGLASVESDVTQTATALGFGAWTRFWRVEFPLAGPVLLAGLRVVAVSTISLTTVGAVIGVQGLGLLFTDGFQRGITGEVWAGVIVVIVLALVVDTILVRVGRLVMPWTRVVTTRRRRPTTVEVTA
jgi:osmoprotectant transport system permease protein